MSTYTIREIADRLIAIRSATDPTKNKLLWDRLTEFSQCLKKIEAESTTERNGWKPAETAPKDGTHILVGYGPYSATWGFDQSPPQVVHYCPDPAAPGFYPSHGIVQGSYNDKPVDFGYWRHLGEPPKKQPAIPSDLKGAVR